MITVPHQYFEVREATDILADPATTCMLRSLISTMGKKVGDLFSIESTSRIETSISPIVL
jgi:hypothetical protein